MEGYFVMLFSLLGLPLGRLADRMNRRLLIVIGIDVWSVATALSGFATSFGTLFLARVGVGLGEATLAPAAFSLMAQYVPAHRMGRAASIFTLGASLGRSLALVGGGALLILLAQPGEPALPLLASFKPWQVLFLFASLPGFAMLLLIFTVREPPRDVQRDGGSTFRHTRA